MGFLLQGQLRGDARSLDLDPEVRTIGPVYCKAGRGVGGNPKTS